MKATEAACAFTDLLNYLFIHLFMLFIYLRIWRNMSLHASLPLLRISKCCLHSHPSPRFDATASLHLIFD
ncbi:hypothetical protein Y032_0044g996 [Ancylostoma ceylanicum]|nr:hypothetical protein Y032_0044g996 [Ancylostoma ceylanicum]